MADHTLHGQSTGVKRDPVDSHEVAAIVESRLANQTDSTATEADFGRRCQSLIESRIAAGDPSARAATRAATIDEIERALETRGVGKRFCQRRPSDPSLLGNPNLWPGRRSIVRHALPVL